MAKSCPVSLPFFPLRGFLTQRGKRQVRLQAHVYSHAVASEAYEASINFIENRFAVLSDLIEASFSHVRPVGLQQEKLIRMHVHPLENDETIGQARQVKVSCCVLD
jgi:hypothetical protein